MRGETPAAGVGGRREAAGPVDAATWISVRDEAPSRSIARIASTTARADGGRSSAFLASKPLIRSHKGGGKEGFNSRGGVGVVVETAWSIERRSSPLNGGSPVAMR